MMTSQEQRIAIADWMKDTKFLNSLDYPNDLNAMHEAEKKLSLEGQVRYITLLWEMFPDPKDKHKWNQAALAQQIWWWLTTTTAAQRSEALCRTLWPERFE